MERQIFSQDEVNIFFDEFEEKIDLMGQRLLVLEKRGSDPELIDDIFRAAHTIKGSSGMMGFSQMARLTHEMENIFDKLRQGELVVTPSLMDELFLCLDMLKKLEQEIRAGEEEQDVSALIDSLSLLCGDTDTIFIRGEENEEDFWQLTEEEEILFNNKEMQGENIYGIEVLLDEDCMMKSIRTLILMETLIPFGSMLRTSPARNDLDQGVESEIVKIVYLSPEPWAKIEELINTVPETTSCILKELKKPTDKALKLKAKEQSWEANGRQTEVGTLRVDIRKLDALINLVGELVINRTRLTVLNTALSSRYEKDSDIGILQEISERLARITTELHEEIMKTRMLPVAQLFHRFPRIVRDLSQKCGKEIELVLEGEETELDRTVIETIQDPLMHLIRNGVDHGIEFPEERIQAGKSSAGRIFLKAKHQDNQIIIQVEDDGRGINVDKVKEAAIEKGLLPEERVRLMEEQEALDLIFLPGFSTSRDISDISGRGVGMDVVRKNIEQVNGTVQIATSLGKGTIFTIRLPLTLAVISSLLINNGGDVYAIPLVQIRETLMVKKENIKTVQGRETIIVRGEELPLVRLRDLFNEDSSSDDETLYAVVVNLPTGAAGVIVDEFLGEQEIVVKSLGKYLGKIPGYSGASILGDGRVILILDVKGLMDS